MDFSKHLTTDRLLLRPMTASDFRFFARLVGNREVRRYLGGPVPWTRRFPRFIAYLRGAPDTGVWVAQIKGPAGAVGLVELGPHVDGDDHELSFQFDPEFWGQGLAREAASAVMTHALTDRGLPRIIAETQRANEASCRLLRHLGMVELQRTERFGAEQVIFTTVSR